jgi:hypothetical protein
MIERITRGGSSAELWMGILLCRFRGFCDGFEDCGGGVLLDGIWTNLKRGFCCEGEAGERGSVFYPESVQRQQLAEKLRNEEE